MCIENVQSIDNTCYVTTPKMKYARNTLLPRHISKEQNRSTDGYSKLKRSVDMTSSGKNCLNIITKQVPNGTGPGVRMSKHPLLVSRTHYKCPIQNLPE